jgi:hypothetical protein
MKYLQRLLYRLIFHFLSRQFGGKTLIISRGGRRA